MQRLILASASPARARLLTQAGFKFEIRPTDIDEAAVQKRIFDPATLVTTLATRKAQAHLPHRGKNDLILAADTVVFCQGRIIGKPKDRADARRIINTLSGRTHYVWTGVCLIRPQGEPITFAEKSAVTLLPLTDQATEAYLDTHEWVGNAGGYQIGKTISHYVSRINGSYTGIIGLPLARLKTVI